MFELRYPGGMTYDVQPECVTDYKQVNFGQCTVTIDGLGKIDLVGTEADIRRKIMRGGAVDVILKSRGGPGAYQ